jgi:hypothetical protein
VVLTDETPSNLLRGLGQPLETGSYRVVLVTKEIHMRGADFRAFNVKITLVLQRGFTT